MVMGVNRLIDADYSVQYLLPPSVDDWVPSDHPVRFLCDFVECLDLPVLGFKIPRNLEGGPVYAPSLLLKIWLYAWYERVRSTRKMERLCRTDLPLIWLTGQNYPDHNTLWRFWDQNRKPLKKILRQSVRIAMKAELVGLVLHAVDGTKILAHSARRSALHRADLEKVLAKADQSIASMEDELEQSRRDEQTSAPDTRLEPQLTEARQRRLLIQEGLELLKANDGADHLQPSEPDARQMKSGRRVEWAWNAQAVVDQQSQLIVAADLDNKAADAHHLVSMIDQVKENTDEVAKTTTADSGYSKSDQELADAKAKDYGVVAARSPEEKDPYHRIHFTYDRQQGTCVCPQGIALSRDGSTKYEYQEGRAQRFRCSQGEKCPVFEQCRRSDKSRQRTVEFGPHHELILEQKKLLESKKGGQALQARQELVEPVFGSLKHNDGFRRVNVRGEDKAGAQWALICVVWNLRRLYLSWREGKLPLEKKHNTRNGAKTGAEMCFVALSEDRWVSLRDIWEYLLDLCSPGIFRNLAPRCQL